MRAAITDLTSGRAASAERRVRAHLLTAPDDVASLALLADIALRAGVYSEAAVLLRRAVLIAPGFTEGSVRLAETLFQIDAQDEAIAILSELIERTPDDRRAVLARIRMLSQSGRYEEAASEYERLIAVSKPMPAWWVGYGNVLKTLGRTPDAIAAYRRALAIDSGCAPAWWSLAEMKSALLDTADITTMMSLLQQDSSSVTNRIQLHFAIAKALDDAGETDDAFQHWADGNRSQRHALSYDADATTREVDDMIALLTPAFVDARDGAGCMDDAPIFVIGLPRSGSTLIEQILASHSAVEGTAELPHIPLLLHRALTERRERCRNYAEAIASLTQAELTDFGAEYIRATAAYRKLARPRFVDKLPNNWLHIAFIRMILPRARVIDARRHAMACCFSNFTQLFARGQEFTYDQVELGRYYRDYVRLMRHVDDVLPRYIHRVDHEELVTSPEINIRGLLNYCGLDYEPGCLTFHANPRAVRTASAEQVRRPLNTAGFDRWRRYRTMLRPLETTLGPELVSDQ